MTTGTKILNIASLALLAGAAIYIFKRQKAMIEAKDYREVTETLPRGYRNNNPLNIRYNSANNWQGKVLPNTDGAFEQFANIAYGYRAAFKLIRNYISQGYKTVAQIIARWAPSTENNTDGYINRVCQTTGFYPSTVIMRNDRNALEALVYAMAIFENGYIPLPNKTEISQGYDAL